MNLKVHLGRALRCVVLGDALGLLGDALQEGRSGLAGGGRSWFAGRWLKTIDLGWLETYSVLVVDEIESWEMEMREIGEKWYDLPDRFR